jgi:hypothetical protein
MEPNTTRYETGNMLEFYSKILTQSQYRGLLFVGYPQTLVHFIPSYPPIS